MKDQVFQEVLALLVEVRDDLTRGANSSAVEQVDDVIELLLKARDKGWQDELCKKDVLEQVGKILPALGQIANLINTLFQSLR